MTYLQRKAPLPKFRPGFCFGPGSFARRETLNLGSVEMKKTMINRRRRLHCNGDHGGLRRRGANAVVCARGVYRAGCAGPRGRDMRHFLGIGDNNAEFEGCLRNRCVVDAGVWGSSRLMLRTSEMGRNQLFGARQRMTAIGAPASLRRLERMAASHMWTASSSQGYLGSALIISLASICPACFRART